MSKIKKAIIILLFSIFLLSGFVQQSGNECKQQMDKNFISEEQEYTAEFNHEGKAFFHSTFYSNTTYRIITCRSQSGVVKFTVSDHQKNLIFSNEEFNYSPFWDFLFENTVDCIITVERLDSNELNNQATATLLIGFKK